MINMSILDENAVDIIQLQMENQQLKQQLKDANEYKQWIQDQMWAETDPRLYYPEGDISRSTKLNLMYDLIYGDTPLCDTCDGATGFFLIIDRLYSAIINRKWLLRILRWGNYYKRR